MQFWYKLLTYLFYPLAFIYLILRKFNKKEHPRRYKEKLSQIKIIRPDGFLLWCHVASIGEAMSILPLVEELKKYEKIKKILITSIFLFGVIILKDIFIILVNFFSKNVGLRIFRYIDYFNLYN